MAEEKKQDGPKQVRLYPPVQAAWNALNQEENFNYFVNASLAEKLGVQKDLTPYRRK